ncbi:hypothetical protein ACUNWD_18140 [Sunxiuqinia sp. A32]|uniref:hypothetical protein n=1 Tax=Sunxiuqinia sp. A32 TaxID=3461496 RepID=UPI004045681A
MAFLNNVETKEELVKEYRRLARKYHPDHGGNDLLMGQLNKEYEQLKKMFERPVRNFDDLRVGDIVFVNGTECRVSHVSTFAFIAKARYKNKSAVFDRKTGRAIGNRNYRATLI